MLFSYHQMIQLTVFARAQIAGLAPPPFAKTLSMKHGGGMAFKGVAETPEEWFASLNSAAGARLHTRSSSWKIEIYFASGPSDFWRDDDSGSSAVCYLRKKGAPQSPQARVPDAAARLVSVLDDSRAFSSENDCRNFARIFTEARACLAPDATLPGDWLSEFSPGGVLAPDAARLLAASMTAWVFGGMGSWNDLCFDGAAHEKYRQLSTDLHVAICDGIAAALSY